MRTRLSLFQQNALRLLVVFVLFELLLLAATLYLLMLPMARQGASDLASLMMMTAKTWQEAPPASRPALGQLLLESQQLVIADARPAGTVATDWHGPYAIALEDALQATLGRPVALVSADLNGQTWHWVELPAGGQSVWLGFPHDRIGTRKGLVGVIMGAAGFAFALLAALWLARRTVAPLEQLSDAAASLGRGETPTLLAEDGPRELARLCHCFNDLSRRINELLDARTTLLAGLSHDLRTPLARIRVAVEMAGTQPGGPWLERIERDVLEMNSRVGEMLELARGLGREEPRATDLYRLAEDIANKFRESGADVQVLGKPVDLPLAASAFDRILTNLVDNAVRYGSGLPVTIHVESHPDAVTVTVADRGPGIPDAQLDAVFRPFHRVDGSRSRSTGGTGLGLAIVRQMATTNGYSVHLENRPDGGLLAVIRLPNRSHTAA